MEKKHVAWFPGNRIEIYPDPLMARIKNQLENDRVKVSGSLEDRYQIYLENNPEDPLSFDDWLNR